MRGFEERLDIFAQHAPRLKELAYRALNMGLEPDDFLIVCIDVDDPGWRPLVDHLKINADWQQIRDRGERPLALGSVVGPLRDNLADSLPALAEGLFSALPEGNVRAVILAAGGGSLWHIRPVPEKQ